MNIVTRARPAVIVFDAYGTLFDLASATGRHLDRLGELADPLADLWRRKQLEYTWLRSLMADSWVPFERIVADALDHAISAIGVETHGGLRERLLDAYRDLDTYPEVSAVLDTLQADGVPLAILSNGSRDMLTAAVDAAGISSRMQAVISVDAVAVFKPHPAVYCLVLERFGIAEKDVRRVLFVSANAWDAVGAARFGFEVLWCNRAAAPAERLGAAPDGSVRDLNGVVQHLARGRR